MHAEFYTVISPVTHICFEQLNMQQLSCCMFSCSQQMLVGSYCNLLESEDDKPEISQVNLKLPTAPEILRKFYVCTKVYDLLQPISAR